MSPNATSRQLHVSLAENHRCDPVVRLRITSGLPVTREQSPVMSTNQTCGVRAYMRAAEALQKSLHVNASLF
jgi:hypothetical protein